MKTVVWMLAPIALLGSVLAAYALGDHGSTAASLHGPRFTADGKLMLPADYREWVYLSTGFDMSYSPRMQMGHHMFDNVFVEPAAYQAFKKTGTWPDKTLLVLETRGAMDKGSINQSGNYQGTELMGVEVHLKDAARFKGGWGFFAFDGDTPAGMIPVAASCYSCHAEHAAVDTTFVQFYPTLLPIAEAKATLSGPYQKDLAAAN
jgi:Cytochrome P460